MQERERRSWRTLAALVVLGPVFLASASPAAAAAAVAAAPVAVAAAPAIARVPAVTAQTALGALAPGSKECLANKAAGTVRFASPFGYDASAGIIDVYAALKLGYFADLCLNVDFVYVPFTESPYSLVSAGTAQITGEGSAADAIVQESEGSDFVAVSTYGDTSDYALLTRSGITKLTQLDGKVLGYHPTFPVVLREMLVKGGVDLSKLRSVIDPSFNPLLLIHGTFSAIQAYQSNEPITLRADHEPFTMWTPAQFGIPGTFNVQVVNRKFLASHPTATADFLRAEFLAFNYCVRNAVTCVDFLAKAQGPTFDVAHGEAEWRFESMLALDHHLPGEGVGVQSPAEWAPEADAVVQYKLLDKAVNLASVENTSITASLYHGTQLIWP
ncbi:MAG TPA: ABC transporter substrate-binding protein [Acidimicrobiales bacterium]|nr:ABC transporter substrate-binding protein [Acidimicrobiales bacterium]